MKNQKGFSAHFVLLFIIVIAIIGFIGWFVWDKNQDQSKDTTSKTQTTNTNTAKTNPVTVKKYVNTEYGFSFGYNSDWTLKEDKMQIVATSPNNTEITFTIRLGGKGGSCADTPEDQPHNTKGNCTTLEVLQVNKIADKTGPYLHPLYLYETKHTTAGANGVTTYNFMLDNNDSALEKKAYISDYQPNFNVLSLKNASLEVEVQGGNASSEAYFDSVQGQETKQLLSSYRAE